MPYLQLDTLQIELIRKNVKRLRLTVYAPDGRVRITAPLRMPLATIEEFVATRQAWIRKHQSRFAAQEQPVTLTYESGEMHFYQGQRYELRVHETSGRARVLLQEQYLDVYVPVGSTPAQRAKLLADWYRARLKEQLPTLVAKWEPVVGAHAQAWGIKQMKTRWGTCNITAKRIWLNLELMKQPLSCLEYVVVHELVHLHERLHNAHFWGLMDQFMPDWREHKAALSRVPLGLAAAPDAD